MTTDLNHDALDALAGVIRDTGLHAFELPDRDLEQFNEACEAWARHVLTGTPVTLPETNEAPGESDAADDGRAFKEVRHFFLQHRQAEQAFVTENVGAFKSFIWDLVGELKALAESDRAAAAEVGQCLEELECAADDESMAVARQAIRSAVQGIRGSLSRQREHYDTQLASMTARLDTMRDDLLESREHAQIDSLTRVYNRGAFDAGLTRYVSMAELTGQSLVLLLVDLDHFKEINDDYGHPCGDLVLHRAAKCIQGCFLRKGDFVARYGGDEFAVLLLDVDEDAARVLAEKLLQRLRKCDIEYQGKAVFVTCSVGYAALSPGDAEGALVERADAALYQAKEQGRDCVAGA